MVDSCWFWAILLAPCCDPPSQKRCAASLGQSLCWLRRAVQTPGQEMPRSQRHDRLAQKKKLYPFLHAGVQCDRKFEVDHRFFFMKDCESVFMCFII